MPNRYIKVSLLSSVPMLNQPKRPFTTTNELLGWCHHPMVVVQSWPRQALAVICVPRQWAIFGLRVVLGSITCGANAA